MPSRIQVGQTAPVRIRAADKRRLDRLQAEITARTGEKITLQELVTRLLDLGERHRLDLEGRPATKEEIEWLMSLPVDTGEVTREEDIDRILYGEPE